MTKSISEWMKEANKLSHEKGWYDEGQDNSFPTKVALLHSEVSELLEEYRNNKPFNEIYYSEKGKPEGPAAEAADIFIRLCDLCQEFGIDLEKGVEIKHEFNKTRPHRHGGKKI